MKNKLLMSSTEKGQIDSIICDLTNKTDPSTEKILLFSTYNVKTYTDQPQH